MIMEEKPPVSMALMLAGMAVLIRYLLQMTQLLKTPEVEEPLRELKKAVKLLGGVKKEEFSTHLIDLAKAAATTLM